MNDPHDTTPNLRLLHTDGDKYIVDVNTRILREVVDNSPNFQWRYSNYDEAQHYFWYTRIEVPKPLYITLCLKYS